MSQLASRETEAGRLDVVDEISTLLDHPSRDASSRFLRPLQAAAAVLPPPREDDASPITKDSEHPNHDRGKLLLHQIGAGSKGAALRVDPTPSSSAAVDTGRRATQDSDTHRSAAIGVLKEEDSDEEDGCRAPRRLRRFQKTDEEQHINDDVSSTPEAIYNLRIE